VSLARVNVAVAAMPRVPARQVVAGGVAPGLVAAAAGARLGGRGPAAEVFGGRRGGGHAPIVPEPAGNDLGGERGRAPAARNGPRAK
jgi:hypothetical protein